MSRIHLILMPEYGDSSYMLPPLGIASLAAHLKRRGIQATCADFRPIVRQNVSLSADSFGGIAYVDEVPELPLILSLVRNYREGKPLLSGFEDFLLDYVQHRSVNYHALKSHIEQTHRVLEQEAQRMTEHSIVGFSTVSSNLFYTVMLSLMLRLWNRNIKIIYGSPQVTLSTYTAKLALRLYIADVVILSDAEETLCKVINLFERGAPLEADGTVTYNRKEDAFLIRPPKALPDLNTLPNPDFSVFQLEQYSPLTLPMYASRGCIYKCSFCSYNRQTGTYRLKKPKGVVDTMDEMHRKYNTMRFAFSDSALNLYPQWTEQVADELIRRKYRFQWSGFFRPHIKKELLIKLKKSGLFMVTLGVESFASRVLERMRRESIPSEVIIKTIDLVCSADIKVNVGVITGFPGESKGEFLYTLRQLLQLQKRHPRGMVINSQRFQVRVCSDCYTRYDRYGLALKNWDIGTSSIIPEVRELVKKIPMAYVSDKPKNRETDDRIAFMRNITSASDYLPESDKLFLKACVRRLGSNSIVRIENDLGKVFSCRINKKKKYFFPHRGLFVDEKEIAIMKLCNGQNTVRDIVDRILATHRGDRRKSFKAVVRVLRFLLDNNIGLNIRNIR